MKKGILFIIGIICLLFSGCERTKTEADVSNVQTVYTALECGVSGLQGTIHSTPKVDSKIYAGVYTKGNAVKDGRYGVVSYDIEDNSQTHTLLKGREEMVMWSFTVLEDGNYKALFFVWNSEKKGYDSLCLMTFDREGEVLHELDITQQVAQQVEDTIIQNSFCLDRKGNLYFYTSTYEDNLMQTRVYQVGQNGEVSLRKVYSGEAYGMQVVSSKIWLAEKENTQTISLYEFCEENNGDTKLAELDLSAKSQLLTISDGITDAQKFIVLDGKIYEYDMNSKQLLHIFSFEDVGLEFGIFNTGQLIATGPDEFYILKKTGETTEGERKYDYVKIQKTQEVSTKEILTIAVGEEDSLLKEAITSFNRSSDQYKVEVKIYEEEGNNSPLDLLQADITAGKIPDMIAVDILDFEEMINKGLLHDLSDLLGNDSDIERSDFVDNALEIYTRGNKLYSIPQCLCITALTGKKRLLCERENWSLDEFKEYIHQLPDRKAATDGISKNLMLQIVLEQYLSHFVNWEQRSCSFENQEFAELLEFINMYPEEGMDITNHMDKLMEGFREDEIVLYPNAITNLFDFQIMRCLWGEEIMYIGFPAAGGTGIQMADTFTAYVITESSKHKQEMWEILKYMVTNPGLAKAGLPAYRPLYNKACEEAMEKKFIEAADGTLVEVPQLEIELAGMKLEIWASTQQDIDVLNSLFEKAEPVKATSSAIKGIIQEEAVGYFSGQKEVTDVAAIIQNRVTNYLNE